MNIYLLTRTDDWGYDTYDSFVIAAPDIDTALKICEPYVGTREWPANRNLIEVQLIGTTEVYTEPTEILGSYNAG